MDRWTGFVRFGHRDYDPEAGRFTAPDPLGDTGGDHDPYEYCVDDPVNAVDPRGEFVISGPIGLFLAGKALAGAIAGTGLFAASKAVGDPDVTVQAGDKKIDTKLSTAAGTAGALIPVLTGAAGATAMSAPETIPAAGRAAAALAGKAGQAAAKVGQAAGQAAAKADTAINSAALAAIGKTAETASKVSPKVGEILMRPEPYAWAKDAITSYAPTGPPEQTYAGAIGGGVGLRKEIMDLFDTTDPKQQKTRVPNGKSK